MVDPNTEPILTLRAAWVNGRGEESAVHSFLSVTDIDTGHALCGQFAGARPHIVPDWYGESCQVCKELA